MSISLIPLPYAATALAPTIPADTLELHHGGHHRTYVDTVNAATKGGPLAGAGLAAIITAAAADEQPALFNNAAQAWNHGFYWHSLSPAPQQPDAALGAAIDKAFGSLAALKQELILQGTAQFGAGWVWLVKRGDALSVEQTHDAATFAVAGPAGRAGADAIPLLVIDVWEHAYYLDYRNVRKNYLHQVTSKLLAWGFASENFARKTAWVYPDLI